MVFLLFAFGGWEDALVPTGEINEPRRSIPFGLGTGLFTTAVIYMLLQFITVATIGTKPTDAPLQETAAVLIGSRGAAFVNIAALVSIYGWISAAMLYAPRLAYSLAAQGDFPAAFRKMHTRFHTPAFAILFYALKGVGAGSECYVPLASRRQFRGFYRAICCDVCFPDAPPKVATDLRCFANSIRTNTQHFRHRDLSGAGDRTKGSRSSLDVCHCARGHRELAMGETSSLGARDDCNSGSGLSAPCVIESRLWNRKATMIARQWIGETLASDADTYLKHLEETGVKECEATRKIRASHHF